MLDYLSNPRDRAVLGATPTLMQPVHDDLPPVGLHQYRFVAGLDGLYLQARTPVLDASLRIADTGEIQLPYGPVKEHIRLADGRLPVSLFHHIIKQAQTALPDEWACLILHDEDLGYRIHIPEVESRSPGHIRYRTDGYDPARVVVDLHTHGRGPAYFSATDDTDDRISGIHLSVVLGRVDQPVPEQATRLVVHGRFLPVNARLWQDLSLQPGVLVC